MSDKQITRPAFGQCAFLGDLYDASTETFLNISMFKSNIPEHIFRTQDIHSSTIKKWNSESAQEMRDFFDLDIKLSLGIFVVIGTLSVEGSFGLLKDRDNKGNQMSGSLMSEIKTVNEQLLISHQDLRNHINRNVFEKSSATHFVFGIDYGCAATVTVESSYSHSVEKDNIKIGIGAELDMFIAAFKAKVGVDVRQERENEGMGFLYKLHTDLPECPLPDTREAVMEYMKRVPILLKQLNNGKGKQMKYVLLPISVLNDILQTNFVDRVIDSIEDSLIRGYLDMFEVISSKKNTLRGIVANLKQNRGFLSEEKIQEGNEIVFQFEKAERELKAKMQELLPKIKRKEMEAAAMDQQLKELRDNLKLAEIDVYVTRIEPLIRNQSELIRILTAKNVTCIGREDDFEIELYNKVHEKTYLNFSREEDDNMHFFNQLTQNEIGVNHCFAYLTEELSRTFQSGLYCFQNGTFDKLEPSPRANLVLYKGNQRFVGEKTGKCLQLVCPNGACGQEQQKWRCARCKRDILYEAAAFYCLCGRGDPIKYSFKCANVKHGPEFSNFKDKSTMDVNLENFNSLKV